MRKIAVLALLMVSAFALPALAQTYCYKIVEFVQNGVKSKANGGYQYFTFQNDMNRFYISDANGYATGSMTLVYNLVSTANGRYKYQQQGPMGPIGNFYIFNSDYSRANATSSFLPGNVSVLKRVDGPEENTEEFY